MKTSEDLQKLSKLLTTGSVIIVFTFFSLIQLAYDPQNLPIGFESEKVKLLKVTALISVVLLILNLLAMFLLNNLKSLKVQHVPYLGAFMAIILPVMLSVFLSPYQVTAVWGNEFRESGILAIVALFIIFVFFFLLFTKGELTLLLNIYLVVIIFHAFLGYLDLRLFSWEEIQTGNYINGNFGQANFFANTLAAGVIISWFMLRSSLKIKNYKLSLFYLATIIFIFPVIFFSFSYGTWLILAIFAVQQALNFFARFLSLKVKKININNKIIINALFLIFSTVGILIGIYNSDESRRIIWNAVIELIQKRPIIGFGPDTLTLAFADYNLIPDRFVDRAHNVLLDLVYNFGLLVLAPIFIYLSGLASQLFDYVKNYSGKNKVNFDVAILYFIIVLYFLSDLFHTKSIFHYGELFVFLAIINKYLLESRDIKV